MGGSARGFGGAGGNGSEAISGDYYTYSHNNLTIKSGSNGAKGSGNTIVLPTS